ncbi:putative terminase large subunit [Vibrio phage 219E41.1]|nr:hypothetical protein PODOV021v1_p0079 [Vibrio phage 219E41.2]QZI91054.1 putative terminase large subunit [Vibrio phage 219E41.1]QZI91128.1 hypothetical protein PODOV060v1_p0034 [Vibrio phage 234P8]QZI91578.1 hypothetical protein PODOV087v1_p0073 [Vibrio phage 431E45.1]QZI91638.1 hypothetical protein PODOV086v1_p0054 [Vibrio phage 431E46.1]QZI91671.1 hypothetical protein PODOV088v1_p0010 [Vibrio phage 431E48.2]
MRETANYYIIESQSDIWDLAEHLRQEAAKEIDPSQHDAVMHKFETDYAYYAHRALKIKTKSEGLKTFSFNKGQWYLHAMAEYQLKTTGKIRIVIVKGRQQGISTFTEGRAYWKASQTQAYNAVVMTHENTATNNLFDMFKRYHENCYEELQPTLGKNNAKALEMVMLDSIVKVFTAKANGTGRSQTASFFHGSEVAFWPNAYEHSTGIMQGISAEDGSEVYLESTAYGNTGYFADMWEGADYPWEEPKPHGNGYLRCFIPWFWEYKYRSPVPEGFEKTPEEMEFAELHDLDNEQLQWRRLKIGEAGGDTARFCRDYPATPEEAFNSSLDNVLIQPNVVLRARKNYKELLSSFLNPALPAVIGCDVAREGDDATCIVVRRGRVILHYEQMYKAKGSAVAKRVVQLSNHFQVLRTFVDNTGGFGGSVLDFLSDIYGYDQAVGVHFSERAHDDEQFKNIRSEMWWKLAEWLEDGAAIPDSSEMQKDFCAPTYKYMGDQFLLESKKDMKSRGIKSPDIGDACALTFAHPVTVHTMSRSYDPSPNEV